MDFRIKSLDGETKKVNIIGAQKVTLLYSHVDRREIISLFPVTSLFRVFCFLFAWGRNYTLWSNYELLTGKTSLFNIQDPHAIK